MKQEEHQNDAEGCPCSSSEALQISAVDNPPLQPAQVDKSWNNEKPGKTPPAQEQRTNHSLCPIDSPKLGVLDDLVVLTTLQFHPPLIYIMVLARPALFCQGLDRICRLQRQVNHRFLNGRGHVWSNDDVADLVGPRPSTAAVDASHWD